MAFLISMPYIRPSNKVPHWIVFFAFDLLHLDGQDLKRSLQAGSAPEVDRARSPLTVQFAFTIPKIH